MALVKVRIIRVSKLIFIPSYGFFSVQVHRICPGALKMPQPFLTGASGIQAWNSLLKLKVSVKEIKC
jgi:hypothetical protein